MTRNRTYHPTREAEFRRKFDGVYFRTPVTFPWLYKTKAKAREAAQSIKAYATRKGHIRITHEKDGYRVWVRYASLKR